MISLNGHTVEPTVFPDGTSQVWNLPLGGTFKYPNGKATYVKMKVKEREVSYYTNESPRNLAFCLDDNVAYSCLEGKQIIPVEVEVIVG